jgi:hypothetical protein
MAIEGPLMSRIAIRSRPRPESRNRPSASVVARAAATGASLPGHFSLIGK